MPGTLPTLVFWTSVLCCVVAEVAIVRGTALARRPAAGAHLPAARRGVEVFWAVLPALALAGVLAWTWRDMQRDATRDAAAPAAHAGHAGHAGDPSGAVP